MSKALYCDVLWWAPHVRMPCRALLPLPHLREPMRAADVERTFPATAANFDGSTAESYLNTFYKHTAHRDDDGNKVFEYEFVDVEAEEEMAELLGVRVLEECEEECEDECEAPLASGLTAEQLVTHHEMLDAIREGLAHLNALPASSEAKMTDVVTITANFERDAINLDGMSVAEYCNSFLDNDEDRKYFCFDEQLSDDRMSVTFKTKMPRNKIASKFSEMFTELIRRENREEDDPDTVYMYAMKVVSASMDGVEFYKN